MKNIFGPFNAPQNVFPDEQDTDNAVSERGGDSMGREEDLGLSVQEENLHLPCLSDSEGSREGSPMVASQFLSPSVPPSHPSSRAVSPAGSAQSSATNSTIFVQPLKKYRAGELPISDEGPFLS